MPILLFLLGAAAVAFVATKTNAKPHHAPPSPYQLDPNLDPRTRSQVEGALAHETDPARLEAFANAIAAPFPYAAWNLRAKAAGLRRMGYGAPQALPQPLPGRSADGLDANLPDNVRFNVVELLTQGTNAEQIEAAAFQLANYPLASAALRLRAAYLRSLGTGRGAPAPGAPQGAAAPAFPPLPGLDPNMTPEIAMQVATALMTENDPAKLRALGNTLMASYPTAATMLLGKANAISSATPTPAAQPEGTQVAPAARSPVDAPPAPQAGPFSPSPPAPVPMPTFPTPAALPVPPSLFDAGMTADEQARVVTALSSENNPAKLRELADAYAGKYPRAAMLLTNKAEAVQTLLISTTAPAPMPAPTAAPVPAVLTTRTYRVKQGDFPIKIALKFGQPEAAWADLVAANPHKKKAPDGNFQSLVPGEDLHLPPSWPSEPSSQAHEPPSRPVAKPIPPAMPAAPEAVPAVLTNTQGLDPNLPADVATAVMNALSRETDPAKLRGFASSIMGSFPVAAGVLLAKANTLGVLIPTPAAPAASPAIPAILRPTGATASPPGTYRVVKGDSPSRIAKKLVGNDRRWPELVAANPSKAKTPDGNFKSLQPNEVLQLPPTWTSPNTAAASGAHA